VAEGEPGWYEMPGGCSEGAPIGAALTLQQAGETP
jgi:hypothetical protein